MELWSHAGKISCRLFRSGMWRKQASRISVACRPGRDVRQGRNQKVAFTEADVNAQAVLQSRPGQKCVG
jgi:hypothetical protein